MQFVLLVIAVCVIAVANAAEWTLDTSTTDGILVGVGMGDATSAIAGSCSSNSGAEPQWWDGSSWTKQSMQAGIILDAATTPGNKASIATTMGGIQVTTDKGASFTHVAGVLGLSQSAKTFDTDSFGVAGQFTSFPGGAFGGVITSTDGAGADWTVSHIEGATAVRYGDYPSASTWYVTEGTWNDNSTSVASTSAYPNLSADMPMSSRLSIGKQGKIHANKGSLTDVSGWFGKIWKTSDAGSTWSNVFSSTDSDYYYFNDISCGSPTTCVAVAEGQTSETGGNEVFAMASQDGGSTWTKTWSSSNAQSLMGVQMISATEGWIAPLSSGRGLATDFYYTTDGGQTWSLQQTLQNCLVMSMDYSDGVGAAACLGSGGNSGAVAMYQ